MKTNAARILDSLGIAYSLRTYDPGDEREEHIGAAEVARRAGLLPEQTFKTLVARGDRVGVFFAVLPADAELDLKALARVSGNRAVELVALKDVTPLTGYVRGGVTALGARKSYPVVVDETIELFDEIAVSAGIRGTQMVLAPADYLRATSASTGPITRA